MQTGCFFTSLLYQASVEAGLDRTEQVNDAIRPSFTTRVLQIVNVVFSWFISMNTVPITVLRVSLRSCFKCFSQKVIIPEDLYDIRHRLFIVLPS